MDRKKGENKKWLHSICVWVETFLIDEREKTLVDRTWTHPSESISLQPKALSEFSEFQPFISYFQISWENVRKHPDQVRQKMWRTKIGKNNTKCLKSVFSHPKLYFFPLRYESKCFARKCGSANEGEMGNNRQKQLRRRVLWSSFHIKSLSFFKNRHLVHLPGRDLLTI